MTHETTPDSGPGSAVTMPADRAFLVQFRAGPADGPAWQPTGRVEHLDSGRAARFGDWAALRAFIEQTLFGHGD